MDSTPKHVGIIMDGNRRWAKANNKSLSQAYKAGYLALKNLSSTIKASKIEYLSVYAFSTENWNRDKNEINPLFALAKLVAKNEIEEINEEGIRIRILGQKFKDKSLQKVIDGAEKRTENNKNGTLAICFNYGGQQEIVDAVKKIQDAGQKVVDVSDISNNLYAPNIPPVDLIIRTGGGHRLSNFMLWRAAYSEIIVLDKYWPDFTGKDLLLAIEEYKNRKRRFGK